MRSFRIGAAVVLIFYCLFSLTACENVQHSGGYSDLGKIIEADSYFTYNRSSNVIDRGRVYVCSFGKLKIVLINSRQECEILKEVDASLESRFEGELLANCSSGVNKIKIVGL